MKNNKWLKAAVAAACVAGSGCSEDAAVPSDPDGVNGGWVQSETSMARTVVEGETSRIIVAYNDTFEIHNGLLAPAREYLANYSVHGLSISDDGGKTWDRRGQLDPSMSSSIEAMRGDPWVAAAGDLVLYTGMTAPPSDGPRLSSPSGVMLAISTDGADSWQFMEEIHMSLEGERPDGPKVAVSRDGLFAIVTWIERESDGSYRTRYARVYNPRSPSPTILGPLDLDEQAGLSPPPSTEYRGSCGTNPDTGETIWQESLAAGHPVPAVGPDGGVYIARVVKYWNPDISFCTEATQRLEVFRADDGVEATAWTRISDSPVTDGAGSGIGGGRVGEMLGFGEDTDPGVRPTIAVTSREEGQEDVLVAMEQVSASRDKQDIYLRRIPDANTCFSDSRTGVSCSGVTTTYPAQELMADLADVLDEAYTTDYAYAYMPSLFVGNSTSAAFDPRVGLVFYLQPHRGRPEEGPGEDGLEPPTSVERRFTTVIGMLSKDSGQHWNVGNLLINHVSDRPSQFEDTYFGTQEPGFIPCPVQQGYFGHYISGAFQADSTDDNFAVASWGDSREGCDGSRAGWQMEFQQVFSARFPKRL
jgi:hypothetical protein